MNHLLKIIPFFIICFTINTAGQVTFNKRLTFTSDTVAEGFRAQVRIDKRQFMLGYVTSLHLLFAEINDTGGIVQQRILDMDSVTCFGAAVTQDGNIIVTGDKFSYDSSANQFNFRTSLMKINTSGEILWLKTINDSIFQNSYTRGLAVTVTKDGGFAVSGFDGETGVLYFTDSTGNLIRYKRYITGGPKYLNTIIALDDGTFIMSGEEGYFTATDPVVYKLKSDGSVIWRKNIGGFFNESYPAVTVVNDTILYVVSQLATSGQLVYHDPYGLLLHIQKFTTGGMLLMDKLYGDTIELYTPEKVVRIGNGNLVIAGHNRNSTKAWLFCFSENCDSLWYREYEYDSSVMKFLLEPVPTDDGGILTFGNLVFIFNHIGIDQAWCIKTNDFGCFEKGFSITTQPVDQTKRRWETATFSVGADFTGNVNFHWFHQGIPVPGANDSTLVISNITESDTGYYFCTVTGECGIENSDTVRLTINALSTSERDNEVVSVTPNPAQDKLIIRIPENNICKATITDLSGRVMREFSLNKSTSICDISKFSPGIYFVRIQSDTQRETVFKVIVE